MGAGGINPELVLTAIKNKLGSNNGTVWFPFMAKGYSGSSANKSLWFSGHIGINANTSSWSQAELNGVKCSTANGAPTWYEGTYADSGLSSLNYVGNYSTSIEM